LDVGVFQQDTAYPGPRSKDQFQGHVYNPEKIAGISREPACL
jgi:hypothetical protein